MNNKYYIFTKCEQTKGNSHLRNTKTQTNNGIVKKRKTTKTHTHKTNVMPLYLYFKCICTRNHIHPFNCYNFLNH